MRISKRAHNFIHGMSKTRIHNIWIGIFTRTTNHNVRSYKNYGGRGIKLCKRWLKFENFFRDMGEPPTQKHSIERINNNGPYSKINCRWATAKEQANNKSNNNLLLYRGETKTIAQWSEILGIKYATLYMRLNKYGWSIEKAFTTPKMKNQFG